MAKILALGGYSGVGLVESVLSPRQAAATVAAIKNAPMLEEVSPTLALTLGDLSEMEWHAAVPERANWDAIAGSMMEIL
eukprot:COSAG06_NODE_12133_length_1419_cov_4.277273_1_plen_78_part_10